MEAYSAASHEAATGESVDTARPAKDNGDRGPSPLKHRMIARVAMILEMAAREPEGLSLTD
ncbi:MAG: hypothetical protein JWN96_342, partial [Mycobacterium sp.]|nr:hypothetical protein [Mycobacterium sp.]